MIYTQLFKNALVFPILLILALSIIAGGQSTLNNRLKFNLAPSFQIGFNHTDTEYADLDGDGFFDIIAVNGGQGNPNPTIRILFGTGNGGFSEPVVFPSNVIGHTIAVGDLNNDGRHDLVVASWYQNAVAVFLNQGNRQFAAPVISAPPDLPNPGFQYGEFFDLAIADFDGDGNNDVVALQDQIGTRIRFFHYSGQGVLTVFATFSNIASNSDEAEMAVGDLNGDNRPDIVVAGDVPFVPRRMGFIFGQPPGGTLSFTAGLGVEDKAVGISINDLDNDGDKDMAFAFLDRTTPTRHSLQVFRNYGNGTFEALPKMFLEYAFPPSGITTGDFNNDGTQDIAALIGSVYNGGITVIVTHGRGDGTYSGEKYYAVSSSTSISIFSADMNQDNRVDLITASSILGNNTASILFNDNFRGFKAPLVTLWGPNFIDAGDFNNDGYKDLVSSWATVFSTTSGVDILINDTANGFLPDVHHPSPAALNGMKTGDFNGDGKWDAISAHSYSSRGLAAYIGNGNGTLAPPINTPLNTGLVSIIVGDFNSDGKDDVFTINDSPQGLAMLSNGNGTFSAAPNSSITLPLNVPFQLQKGDFNRDSKLDIIITMNSDVKLWLGDGAGRFTQSSVVIPPMAHTVTGDFNGDGNLDLAGTTGNGITGALGDGNGGFAGSFSRPIEGIYSITLTKSVVSADFDLDGFDDVAMIMAENAFGNLIVIPSSGSTPSWKQPVFNGVGVAMRTLIAIDFNSDGKPDLGYLGDNSRGVIYNTTIVPRRTHFDFDGDNKTDISIFRPSNGQWWYQQSSDFNVKAFAFGNSTDKITPGDYDGDGKTDVAFFRPSTGEWFILRSSNYTFFAAPFGNSSDRPTPADFDGDGKTDLAIFRSSESTWYINKSTGGVLIIPFGSSGDIPVPGDYDGDGKADVAIYRPTGSSGSGEWWSLRSSDNSVFATPFGTATDKPVQADYTGDGKTDVAFFRPSTATWFILRSEDLSFFAAPFGASTDIASPGDFDGDGKADLAVFRPSIATWFVSKSSGGTLIQGFGTHGDLPVPSAYVP